MRKWLLLLAAFLLSGWGAGQDYTVGVRLSTVEAVALVSVEVSAGELFGVRVAPIIQGEVRTDWHDVSAVIMGGMGFTYLPPDSTLAVQVNVLYRALFDSGPVRGVPELSIVVVW